VRVTIEVAASVALKKDILFKEWDHCENGIRSLDNIGLRIRTWGITSFGAILAFSIREANAVLLATIFPIIGTFWFFDGLFKGFQKTFIVRNREICDILRSLRNCETQVEVNALLREAEFPAYDQPFRVNKTILSQIRTMFIWHVSFLYLAMLTIASFVFVLLTLEPADFFAS
jgi:hypothetical protein